jgi:dTDP-glucose 4,6-dehydratase
MLVTGADGFIGSHLVEALVRFIGSHLVEALVRRGHAVRAMVLYNSFDSWGWLDQAPREIRDSLEVVAGDVRDPHGVKQAMRGSEVVLHLAALIAIPYSYHSPAAYLATNMGGTLNLLQAARELDVARFVHTSTSEVYGTARTVPIAETHPLQAQSPYAATKIGADQVALSFQRSFGLPVTVLRPFNTYGPRQSTRAVIPTVITQLAAGGRRVRLGALHPTRDFSHVEDTVAGFVAMAESDAAVGEVVNLGTEYEISIADTARLIAEVMGVDIDIESEAERLRPEASEVDRLCADTAKARRLIDWAPRFAGRDGLARGLAATVAWFSDPDNLRRYKVGRYTL